MASGGMSGLDCSGWVRWRSVWARGPAADGSGGMSMARYTSHRRRGQALSLPRARGQLVLTLLLVVVAVLAVLAVVGLVAAPPLPILARLVVGVCRRSAFQ